jgi:AcrR family transcriptional regulator
MARTVNPQEFASKRAEILDAAQHLVFTRGYEQMSIQDVLEKAGISSGAFHHYFSSRGALLDAFIERIQQEVEKPLLPIIRAPNLGAVEKLQGFFDTLDNLRLARRADVVSLTRVWYNDDNALVRQKVNEAVLNQRAPLINEIVLQGVREGIFTTAHPEKCGEMILSLLQGMSNSHTRLLFSPALEQGDPQCIRDIIVTHAAYMDAVERILGAPPNCLARADAAVVNIWVDAVRGNTPA